MRSLVGEAIAGRRTAWLWGLAEVGRTQIGQGAVVVVNRFSKENNTDVRRWCARCRGDGVQWWQSRCRITSWAACQGMWRWRGRSWWALGIRWGSCRGRGGQARRWWLGVVGRGEQGQWGAGRGHPRLTGRWTTPIKPLFASSHLLEKIEEANDLSKWSIF